MKYLHLTILTYLLATLFVVSCQSNTEKKDDHAGHDHSKHDHSKHDHKGHDHEGHDHSKHDHSDKKNAEVSAQDCKNCGMPSDDENWRVKYASSAKEETFFCSPKCYFKASTTEQQYAKAEFVQFSVFGQKSKTVEAKKAYFVTGTDEKAPMGKDFLVTDSPESAKKLLEEKKGKEILTFDKITQK